MKRLLGDKGTLAGLASRAVGWSFLSTVLGRFGQMGFGILLARLLGPSEFGVAAVAYVALMAILSFNELGVSLAIVRWPEDPDRIAPTVASISVGTSLLLYGGIYLGAPDFARAMGSPAATSVVRVLALTVLTSGFVSVPAALLERGFRQDRKLITDQVHGWLGTLVSVALAFSGFGAMSLAIGQVVGGAVSGVLIVIFSPLPLRFGFDRTGARRLLKFGLPLAGSSFVVFLVANVDNLTTGHILGATSLGFYVLAWNLASWPVNVFSQPVRSVAPAMFSRLQHDPAAMRNSFSSVAGLLGAVTLPTCLLISGAAVPLITFIYGPQWVPAAQALVWLAVLGALRIMFELTYDYFVVLARSRVVLTVQVAWLAGLIPTLIIGARLYGIAGVAIAGVTVASVVVLPWYLFELRKSGIRVGPLLLRFALPVLVAAAVGAAARAIARVISDPFAACAVSGLIALAAIGLMIYRMRPTLKELRQALSSPAEPATSAADQVEPMKVTGGVLADVGESHAAPGALPQSADVAAQQAGLRILMALAAPAPVRSDMIGPPGRETTGVLPVYRDLTEARGAGHDQQANNSHSGRHGRPGPAAERSAKAPPPQRPADPRHAYPESEAS